MTAPSDKRQLSFLLKSLINRRTLFLLLSAGILVHNGFSLRTHLTQAQMQRKKQPYVFLGVTFEGLEHMLQKTKIIGYYTDKSLNDTSAAAQFAQAQYTLAPLLLDFNNLDHPFTLLVCSTPRVAKKTIKNYKLIPVLQNQLGIILARNPRAPENTPDTTEKGLAP